MFSLLGGSHGAVGIAKSVVNLSSWWYSGVCKYFAVALLVEARVSLAGMFPCTQLSGNLRLCVFSS